MGRPTTSASDEFAPELAAFMEGHKYDNRSVSEAVRDLARLGLQRALRSQRIRDLLVGISGTQVMRPCFNTWNTRGRLM